MVYTVQVIIEVSAESQQEAYNYIKHAIDHARKAELQYIDSEVIATRPEEEEAK
jgi:hypothetical protein